MILRERRERGWEGAEGEEGRGEMITIAGCVKYKGKRERISDERSLKMKCSLAEKIQRVCDHI